jgi:Integrase core domain
MANVLSEEEKQQVIALGRLGWPLRRIEQEIGIRRETASRYLREAGVTVSRAGRPRAKPAISVTTDFGVELSGPLPQSAGDEEANPAILVTPDPEPVKPAEITPGKPLSLPPPRSLSRCEPYRSVIELAFSQERNSVSIWQDLVDQYAFTGSYQSVKRFVRQLRGTSLPDARAVIMTQPGEEAQVDYGKGPMVRDPLSGKYRRTRLFVMMLAYSRKAARFLVFRSSARVWAELHEKAFRRLGGCVRVLILDNLREGVLKPDIYDPVVNPLYRDVLAHYGAIAIPCRVRDPDRKA